ncbi:alpha/beta fold hydrolase [Macrococcoides canis]|uniref:alpha/beta fold hydrolase n=1 Tax=Macrococcoides canis TaxID=1855823 RepID=UPI001AEC0BD8|nr:alpha/beta hydrolase [Macrococcus canis]QTQ07645.1 alpha/beta hydrolase [Macrococcus canis]QUR95078.1 alpha/beta fold hydrolase [Macrococcus canis]UTH01949.1 alpha/beta hydrolase [Macrococcus canis]UTH06376.1 alpha/beta hydrolase [Macrococcus canis]
MNKIDINGTMINYEDIGEGQAVYFIHGNAIDLESNYLFYEPLFEDKPFRRIYIDLPGMGESEANNSIESTNDILDIVLKFIETLTGDAPLILVGHSFGGYMCLGIMDRLKARVLAGFITCPVVEGQMKFRKVEPLNQQIDEDFEVKDNKSYYDEYLDMTVRVNEETWKQFQKLMVPGIKKANYKFLKHLMRADGKFYQFRCEDNISIHKDTNLYVVLGQNDTVVGYKDQLKFFTSQHIDDIYVLTNTGHNPMIDAYEEVVRLSDKFIHLISQ